MKKYTGSLDTKKMTSLARKGYQIWAGQKSRCSNPNHVSFSTYGKKGIKVSYSSREFLTWFLNQDFKGFRHPQIGRKDHAKDYTFSNLEVVERVANIKERNARLGNPGRQHRKVCAVVNGKEIVFETKLAAAMFFGVDAKTIYNHCERRLLKPRFSWYE